ncbi:hypothetical protein, partial [Amycolatopsis mediterranei]|uniref:hypothetical protein n=1 Tax=Amycolatopsis mediterranei TaxID=33910 RepID=UPI00331CB6B3
MAPDRGRPVDGRALQDLGDSTRGGSDPALVARAVGLRRFPAVQEARETTGRFLYSVRPFVYTTRESTVNALKREADAAAAAGLPAS